LAAGELTKHHISTRTDLGPGTLPIHGDRIQLQQVVLNLVMNGIEAMTLVTDRPRQLLIRSEKNKADTVLVAVHDTGAGLQPENVSHIFDAFYTTKPAGMGMGLPICRSIVEAHGGHLSIVPNANEGATFQFTLPVSA
jgi:signal transduction histidine kinase